MYRRLKSGRRRQTISPAITMLIIAGRTFKISREDREFADVVAAPGMRFLAGQSHADYKADVIVFSAGFTEDAKVTDYTRRDVINSIPHFLDAVLQPWNTAEDKSIIVLAAGNEKLSTTTMFGILPRLFPELRGYVLAVTAVDDDDRVSDFANKCGAGSAGWCLAAPGNVRVAVSTAMEVSEYEPDSGATSFSAPLVAGALAIVLQRFDSQGIMPQEAVRRILRTAKKPDRHLQASQDHGAGILDVGAAIQPWDIPSFATRDAQFSPRSVLALPSASGDALARLGKGMGVTLFDSLQTAFRFPISSFVRSSMPAWEPLPRFSGARTYGARIRNISGGDLHVQVTDRDPVSHAMAFYRRHGLSSVALGDRASFANPYFALMSHSRQGVMVRGKRLGFAVVMAPSSKTEQGVAKGAVMTVQPHRDITMQLGYSDEGRALLGMAGEEGFAFRAGQTLFSSVQAGKALGSGWTILAQGFVGRSDARAARHSLIAEVRPLISSSFDVAATKRLANNDQIMLHVHQPLRIERGAATLRYATWRNAQGLVYDDVSLPLVPRGRELRFGVAYQRYLKQGTLQLRGAYVRQPHHHREGAGALRVLASFDRRF